MLDMVYHSHVVELVAHAWDEGTDRIIDDAGSTDRMIASGEWAGLWFF